MNQRQIQAFRMVMRHGSITAAAGVLGVSQPAVSKVIADLEHAVGFTLFLRKGGKAQPTAEALELAQEVERLFFGLDRLELAAREIRDLRHATLRLATMPAISFEVVPEIIRTFLSRYGSVKVAHDVHISERIADLVSARQFDLGLAQMPVTRRDVDVIASYRMPCVCALPPGHRLSGRASIGPAELAGEPMVALAHHTLTAGHLTQSFLAANVQPTIAVESQPSYAACGLAAVGIGVAIVDPLTPRVFGPERLVTVPFVPAIPFDFHLIKTLDTTLSRAAEAFCEVARDYLDAYAETTRLLHKV